MQTFVENPVTLWVQFLEPEGMNLLADMSEQLASVCPAAPHIQGTPSSNKVRRSFSWPHIVSVLC